MRPAAAAAAAVCVLSGCGTSTTRPTAAAVVPETGTVAWVVDGDTLRLKSGRRVRLVQIDAPEHGECYGAAATRALVQLAPRGTHVVLISDPVLDATDRYGRELRYATVAGRIANLELVAAGDATPYFFHGDRGRYAKTLLALAKAARDGRRGLWGACPGTSLDPTRAAATGAG